MEWILQCLTYNASEDDFLPLFEYCKQRTQQSLLLGPILMSFPPRYIADNGIEVAKLLLGSVETQKAGIATYLRDFGLALLLSEPSPVIQRTLLREVWKTIMRFQSVHDYISCAEVNPPKVVGTKYLWPSWSYFVSAASRRTFTSCEISRALWKRGITPDSRKMFF